MYRPELSKTQQAGPTATSTPDKPVLGPAAEALAAWLDAAAITEGPLFRRLWNHRVGPGLSDKSVARHRPAPGAPGRSAGRLRRPQPAFGFCDGRRASRHCPPTLMALTEHRSVSSVVAYFQSGSATANPTAHLLGGEAGDEKSDRQMPPDSTSSLPGAHETRSGNKTRARVAES